MNQRDPAGLQPPLASPQLADWIVAHQDKLATAMRLIAADGRSNDACLHARQFLDQALGAGGLRRLGSADYRQAANLLDSVNQTQLSAVMDALASVDGELRAAAPAWDQRYAARPQTSPEQIAAAKIRNGEVVESKATGQGIDGAHYAMAYYPRSGKPAIVITTSAMTEEILNFANTQDAAAWLASRSAKITGPLPTSATGPASRTAREEELLAFLVRDPDRGTPLAGTAGPATFTTHLRAELFAAVRWATAVGGTPGYSVIAEAYGRRLLRAPAEVAGDIGWPDATRAMSYLNRLVATPVTESQAAAAAGLLATVDAAASQAGQQVSAPGPAARRPSAVTPTPGERRLLQPPPPLVPGRGSPAPRLLAHPERGRVARGCPMTPPPLAAGSVPRPGRPPRTAGRAAPENRRQPCRDEDQPGRTRSVAPTRPRRPVTPPASTAKR